ncbi:hypothetical protein NCC49_005309 [Naganishia albida]|nr:hypothetical protein NCC49_005309 [Naganishia albida]
MYRFLLAAFLSVAQAQNLGAYLSPCPAWAPFAAIQESIVNSYRLGTDAQCLAAPPTETGYTVCPAPSVFDAFFTDTDVYFRCAESLSETCDGGCPINELCISTSIPSVPEEAFFFCGVPCADGFYLCDDTATKYLNPSYLAFCDPIADQCATCASPSLLQEDGTCAPSGVVSALPVRASARKRDADGYSDGLRGAVEEMDCPAGTRRCEMEGDEWECIAILEDLETCGGCPFVDGIDCASLPGTTFGGVTCDQGRCVAHECLAGWEIVNATCVPLSTNQQLTRTHDPTPHSTHPDLSTETLIPSALGSLSTPQTHHELGIQPRAAESSAGEYYMLHRTQARVPEGTVVTVWLAYSGMPASSSYDDKDRIMGAAAKGIEGSVERVRKMPNVRIVETSGA